VQEFLIRRAVKGEVFSWAYCGRMAVMENSVALLAEGSAFSTSLFLFLEIFA
jgi:hypothetical protein